MSTSAWCPCCADTAVEVTAGAEPASQIGAELKRVRLEAVAWGRTGLLGPTIGSIAREGTRDGPGHDSSDGRDRSTAGSAGPVELTSSPVASSQSQDRLEREPALNPRQGDHSRDGAQAGSSAIAGAEHSRRVRAASELGGARSIRDASGSAQTARVSAETATRTHCPRCGFRYDEWLKLEELMVRYEIGRTKAKALRRLLRNERPDAVKSNGRNVLVAASAFEALWSRG